MNLMTLLVLNVKNQVKLNKFLKNVFLTEDFKTQVVEVRLPDEVLSKLPQVNNQEEKCKTGFGAEAAMEQLTVEEKNISQARWKTYSDDEDSTPGAKEGPSLENKLQYMKIDEVS